MITDDEVLRLFERADPARVDDHAVIDAAGYLDALRTRSSNVTLIEPAPAPTEPTNSRRRPIIIAAAAAVLVIVIGAVALATRDDDSTAPLIDQPAPATDTQGDRSATDPFNRVWPEGATPRGPVTGELVASVWASQQGWHFVYADGRVIRTTDSTQDFREQRLSPEGVDLVRAEIIASGLFDPDRPPPGSELGFRAVRGVVSGSIATYIYGDIRARIGDRLVYLPRRPYEVWTSKFDQLSAKLTDLESWLPPSAWADRSQMVYVPSHYAVCMSGDEPSSIETLLPAAAADLLAGARRWTPEPWEQPGDETQRCFDLTTEGARRLAEVLDAAIAPWRTSRLVRIGSHRIDVTFLPYMPHGMVECACYGMG